MSQARLKPFLKWAGGKRWLFESRKFSLPSYSGRYIEPFLGGGAAFFYSCPQESILSDSNRRLVELYQAIRETPERVTEHLKQHASAHSRDHYYLVRNTSYARKEERAAQFLYLNRACWNGLYRENLKGFFNVPIGTKQKILYEDDTFTEWSRSLRRSTIIYSDFEPVIDMSKEGDIIFVDPPYTVKHNMNGFIKYNQKIFAWSDQVRLRDALQRALNRGASFVVTNANHDSIKELYFSIGEFREMARHSVIAGSSLHRVKSTELLILSKK